MGERAREAHNRRAADDGTTPSPCSTEAGSPVPPRISKVLLVYPFCVTEAYDIHDVRNRNVEVQPPLGLGYLSAYLKAFCPEVTVEVLDANAMAVRRCLAEDRVDMPALWEALRQAIADAGRTWSASRACSTRRPPPLTARPRSPRPSTPTS